MRYFLALSAIAAAATLSAPAHAQGQSGSVQVKLMGSAVLPDGEISTVKTDLIGLPAGTQTEANENYVPTAAVEFFFTPNLSAETICCLTQHDVDAVAGLPGAELVSDAKLIPATLTLKYHLNAGGISPYVGAGPALFLWIDEKPGAAAVALGADDLDMTNELGLALQAGVDVPIGGNGFALSLDAKRYFVGTTARWYAGGTKVIETEHDVDPWVLSGGVAYRF